MNVFQKAIILAVKFYQRAISPFLGPRCRYYPSCSKFCIQAVSKYGVVLGLYCSIRRVLKCNPFSRGGIEYVEEYENDRIFIFLSSLLRHTRRMFLGGGPA